MRPQDVRLTLTSFCLLAPTLLCAYGLAAPPHGAVPKLDRSITAYSAQKSWCGVPLQLRGGGDKIAVRFEARAAHTQPGQTVVLLGSVRALRCWNASEAIGLKTSRQDFPWWSTELKLPVGDTIEWKVAVRTESGHLLWEGGPNRRAVVPDAINHTFAFDFGDQDPAFNRSADDASNPTASNSTANTSSATGKKASTGSAHDEGNTASISDKGFVEALQREIEAVRREYAEVSSCVKDLEDKLAVAKHTLATSTEKLEKLNLQVLARCQHLVLCVKQYAVAAALTCVRFVSCRRLS